MPRVNLFIADDVGLGKTIEAGLIASELLLRRRIKGIVVAAPPNMLVQWQEEMDSRFGLRFEILDRLYLEKTRQERGYAVNPWTAFPRFLVSHKLLIDETYMAPLRDYLGAVRTNSSSSMPGGWRGRGGGGGLNISDTISRGRAQARELIFSCGFSRSRGRLLP